LIKHLLGQVECTILYPKTELRKEYGETHVPNRFTD
jgi:hypothetical protein